MRTGDRSLHATVVLAVVLSACSGTEATLTGQSPAATPTAQGASSSDAEPSTLTTQSGDGGTTAVGDPSVDDDGPAGSGAAAPHAGSGNEQAPSPVAPDAQEPSPWQVTMLRIEDMPTGWEEVDAGDGGDPDGGDPDGVDPEGGSGRGPEIRICDKTGFGAGVEFEAAQDVAGAVFRAALFGPYATSIAATLPSGQVERLLTELDSAGRSCRTWIQTDDDGNETIFTIEPIEAGELGEQSVGFGIRVTSGGFSFEMDLIMWRFGDVGAGMFHAGTPGAVDRSSSIDFATVVAGRMAEIIAGGRAPA